MSGSITNVCRCYDFIVEAVLMGILCMVSFVGNMVSVVCLRADKSKTPTPHLLIALEFTDTAFLVTVFQLRVLTSVRTCVLSSTSPFTESPVVSVSCHGYSLPELLCFFVLCLWAFNARSQLHFAIALVLEYLS